MTRSIHLTTHSTLTTRFFTRTTHFSTRSTCLFTRSTRLSTCSIFLSTRSSVCRLVVLIVLSVGLFITDPNFNAETCYDFAIRIILKPNKSHTNRIIHRIASYIASHHTSHRSIHRIVPYIASFHTSHRSIHRIVPYIASFRVRSEFLWFFLSKGFGEKC